MTDISFDKKLWTELDEKYARKGMSEEENRQGYKEMAQEGSYQQKLSSINYRGYEICATQFHIHAQKLGMPKSCHIMDIAAGTGLVANMLRDEYGYTCFSGVDGCQEMLDNAPSDLYMNKICSFVGNGHVIPVEDDLYDAAVAAGAFAEGHLQADALHEIFRIVKPGGVVVFSMRASYIQTCDTLTDIPVILKQMIETGKAEKIAEIIDEQYMIDFSGITFVYRKLQ